MRHDLDYMMSVMQAAKEGKDIQFKMEKTNDWCDNCYPDWNWERFDYRIKPEETKPEYVPYESAWEFLQAQLEHGLYIKSGEGTYFIPSCVMNDAIIIDCGGMGISDRCFYFDTKCMFGRRSVMDEFTWQDGTPCGKLKQ